MVMPMFTSNALLAGTVVIEATAFRWSVTDGYSQRLTVSHRILGCATRPLTASPHSQARDIGREMLLRSSMMSRVRKDISEESDESRLRTFVHHRRTVNGV